MRPGRRPPPVGVRVPPGPVVGPLESDHATGTGAMGRHDLRQLCAFVLACGVYFGAIPHLFFLGLRGVDADDFAALAFEAILSWLLLAAVYVCWRRWTPLAVHRSCVALGLLVAVGNPDDMAWAGHFVRAPLGRCCWVAALISFPVWLGLLALSAVLGRRVEPLTDRLARNRAA